jgi:Haspin like kinase domain
MNGRRHAKEDPTIIDRVGQGLHVVPNFPADISAAPDIFAEDQAFALLCLPYSGVDLESYTPRSWWEALVILLQVAQSLAEAEAFCQFEVGPLCCLSLDPQD